MGEFIRYFMYKYNVCDYKWYGCIINALCMPTLYFSSIDRLDGDVQCETVAIRVLCESRDSCGNLMFDAIKVHIFIDTLCTLLYLLFSTYFIASEKNPLL